MVWRSGSLSKRTTLKGTFTARAKSLQVTAAPMACLFCVHTCSHNLTRTSSAGFGVIFDTFKNTETIGLHRDISLVYNDGSQSQSVMLEKKEGCDAAIRYHESRGDFTVESSSRAKVVVTDGTHVSVMIDGKNDGTFVHCASMHLPLTPEWARTAHVGVTASTGQLADNHDVLSLVTFSDAAAHETYVHVIEPSLFLRTSCLLLALSLSKRSCREEHDPRFLARLRHQRGEV